MSGSAYPDFSELAYHIISLCDFWRRSNYQRPKDKAVQVISRMIEISFGIDEAGHLARAVIEELDAIRIVRTGDKVDPDGIEVVFISAFLQEYLGALEVPSTTAYWASVFR